VLKNKLWTALLALFYSQVAKLVKRPSYSLFIPFI